MLPNKPLQSILANGLRSLGQLNGNGVPCMAKNASGSVQCTGAGVSVQEIERQLTGAGIEVLSSACGSDGSMHPSVCGAPDGRIGIVQVPESQAQAQAAAKLGFAPLSELPDATKIACQ
ncbi:MAG: hypothetical protein EXR39_13120 [Betaproteobacteria bacterium]|nr:hypothetical protein [Betaproteobacteria bacterium]